MNIFSIANTFTAQWEGGFVNHPDDPGGVTNYGVSLRWLKDSAIDLDGDGVINIADIHAMTPKIAAALFKKHFWDLLQLDTLPPLAAIVTYDAAVNTGRWQAVKFLQQACNSFAGDNIAVDSILGPKTRARAKSLACSGQALALTLSCIEAREDFHNQLAANSPYPDGRNYRPFLRGWHNRTRALKAYVSALEV